MIFSYAQTVTAGNENDNFRYCFDASEQFVSFIISLYKPVTSGDVAQLVRHSTGDLNVLGSSLGAGSLFYL